MLGRLYLSRGARAEHPSSRRGFKMRLLRRLIAATVLLAGPLHVAAAAQEFPSRYITAIVPFGPGNSVDIVGRLLTARMSELLGQQIIVENIGGAGGSIGTTRAARSAPDGYTIVVGGTDTFAQNQSLNEKPNYHPATDFAPIVLAVIQPIVLVARKDLPVANLRELVTYMKANQGKMQFGSSGIGGATHLACAQITLAAGVTLAHVPYRSAAAGIQDMISGNLDLYCPVAAGALPHIEAGAIKALAVLTDQRSPLLPELPTAGEQGMPGIQGYYWIGLFAPAGTPEPVLARLAATANEALETPAIRGRMKEIGATIMPPQQRTPAYLKKFIPDEIAKWAAIIKASGLSPK